MSIFTRSHYDSWNGMLEHFGKSNFTVIGTCGMHPVICVHSSENEIQAEQAVINWETGKVLHFLGNPNINTYGEEI